MNTPSPDVSCLAAQYWRQPLLIALAVAATSALGCAGSNDADPEEADGLELDAQSMSDPQMFATWTNGLTCYESAWRSFNANAQANALRIAPLLIWPPSITKLQLKRLTKAGTTGTYSLRSQDTVVGIHVAGNLGPSCTPNKAPPDDGLEAFEFLKGANGRRFIRFYGLVDVANARKVPPQTFEYVIVGNRLKMRHWDKATREATSRHLSAFWTAELTKS